MGSPERKYSVWIGGSLLAPCLAIHRLSTGEQLERFKQKYGKEYSSAAEEQLRFKIFSANAAAVETHNAARSSSYTRGINQFSDLTQEEWEAAFLGGYRKMRPPHSVAWTQKLLDTSARMAPDFPTHSMCAGCAGCSSRTPSPSELIFSKQMFWTWNCKINNSVIQK